MGIALPSGRSGAASLLQSGYGNHQIGPLKNLHQLVEDALIVVGARLKVLVEYALSFADGLKSQLLICHRFLPIRGCAFTEGWRIKFSF
jgi:hypothetical protein